MTCRPASLIALREDACRAVYGEELCGRVGALTNLVAPPVTAADVAARPELLARVEVLLTGWGGPRIDAALLAHAPRLRAVFHGAGSVAPIVTADAWRRGLVVTTAAAMNAIPVAEYTVAMIVLSLKQVWRLSREMRAGGGSRRIDEACGDARRCVGLVSLGAIGRAVAERLRGVDVDVRAFNPYVTPAQAAAMGVTLVPSLADLFRQADVVSLHTPLLAGTVRLVRGEHVRAMKPGATFINTSRGAVVDEAALADVASRRPDLQVILDVTERMPLPASSALRTLPNVMLTPHIAGSIGPECRRMGRAMIDELERFVSGQPLRWSLTPDGGAHGSMD